jgi:hypothetical protein
MLAFLNAIDALQILHHFPFSAAAVIFVVWPYLR